MSDPFVPILRAPAGPPHPRWRLAWFGAVAFVAMFGLASLVLWLTAPGESWWAIDLDLILDAGSRLLKGEPLYADPKFLYPPAAAVIGASLAWADPTLLSIIYAAAKVVLVIVCVNRVLRGWPAGARLLAIAGVATCLPFMHDVMLGNVNTLLVAAAFIALYAPDRPRSGIALGVMAALFAKPLIVPILLLLLIRRPRTAGGAAAATVLVTLAAAVVAGPGSYLAWIDALRAGARYAAPFAGNHGITAIAPDLWLPVAVATVIGLVLVIVRGSWPTAVTWAVTSGILLAPYAGTYAALPVVLALPVLGPLMPLAALAIVGLSPVATTYLLPVYAGAILLASLRAARHRAGAQTTG